VLVVLFLGSALFWSGYEQAGSSLNLFAERYTDRSRLAALRDPHRLVSIAELGLHHHFRALLRLGSGSPWRRRNLNPSAPAKFALGVMLMGSGFLVMAAAASIVASGIEGAAVLADHDLPAAHLRRAVLESRGLELLHKLTPKRFVGQMMGMWFLSMSLGNLVAGLIAGEFDANNVAAMPGQYMHIVYFSVGLGAVLLILSRPVKKLMGTCNDHRARSRSARSSRCAPWCWEG
jgi:POT family proton-dependent oligopeptide transporter